MVVRADTHSRLRHRMRAVKTKRKNSQWSIGSTYLCMCVCMNRTGSQPEKNSINVVLSLLHCGNLGHLKEYSWISNPATTAEPNLLNSPAGDNRAGRKQEKECRNWKRGKEGRSGDETKADGEETKKGETAIDAGRMGEGEAEIWRETEEVKKVGERFIRGDGMSRRGAEKQEGEGGEEQEWSEERR